MSNSRELSPGLWESDSSGVPEEQSVASERRIGRLSRSAEILTGIIACVWMTFHVYTTWRGNLPLLRQLSLVAVFAFSLVFIWHPVRKKFLATGRPLWAILVDSLWWVASVGGGAYIAINFERLQSSPGNYSQLEIVIAMVIVAAMMEGCRRVLGLALPIFAGLAILYAYYGGDLGGFGHPAYTTERIFSVLVIGQSGVFSSPMTIIGTFLAMYMLFAAAMQVSGTGDYFVRLANALFGRRVGGVGKVSIVSSGLFGMVSGAGVANAATTGTVTIPAMKRSGYTPRMAAALESTASIGGQVMPPVMGAAAFLISSFLGIPYGDVVKAAILPAIFYFLTIYLVCDFESRRSGIGRELSGVERIGKVLRSGAYQLLPLVILLWALLGANQSPARAGLYGLLAAVAVSMVRADTRITPRRLISVMIAGARMTVPLVLAVGCVGVVIGVVSMSGTGIKLSGILIDAAGGSTFLLLFFTMIASLILGAGLPTTPTYLFLAILVAPALGDAGLPMLAAHLFIFYYGVFGDMTPPLAVAPFVSAGIAGADPWKTTWTVCRIGLAAWILPFMFVYSEGFLLNGGPWAIGLAILQGTLGMYLLAAAAIGHIYAPLRVWQRLLALGGACLLVAPTPYTIVAGVAVFVFLAGRQKLTDYRANGKAVTAPLERMV